MKLWKEEGTFFSLIPTSFVVSTLPRNISMDISKMNCWNHKPHYDADIEGLKLGSVISKASFLFYNNLHTMPSAGW